MVYVQSIKSYLRDADVMALCHLDYALKVTGGALRDETTGVTGLAQDERLHITGHGDKGSIVGMTVDDIAQRLQADIPQDRSASILITTCYAGSSSGGKNPNGSAAVKYDSVLKQLARHLKGWRGLSLFGYRGPTITNAYMDPRIGFVPDEKVPTAGTIQNRLIGGTFRNAFLLLESQHATWLNTHRLRDDAWLLANCVTHVDAIAQGAGAFYQGFYDELALRNLLGTERDQIATVDILA